MSNFKCLFIAFQAALLMVLISGCGLTQNNQADNKLNPKTDSTRSIPLETKTLTQITINTEIAPKQVLLEGKILRYGDKSLEISQGENNYTLLLVPGTIIWDGIPWIAKIPNQNGDWATAWGEWNLDKTFTVDKLWINIVNLHGIVVKIEDDKNTTSIYFNDQNQRANHILVSPLTVISNSTFSESHQLPKIGDYIEVIGREYKASDVQAVNITIATSK